MFFKEFLKSDYARQPHFLLIGNPVTHSLSPLMHNIALKKNDIEATYHAVNITYAEFGELAVHMNSRSFLGANITLPHKQQISELIDEQTPTAKTIGAINTIIKKNDKLIGDNTDSYGFLVPLLRKEEDLEKERALIFGSGGATKAILSALNDLGFSEVCIVSRKVISTKYSSSRIHCNYETWMEFAEEASLIINATPLGMKPNIDASPVQVEEAEILNGKICYDIVYNPKKTKFLKIAEAAGGVPIGGIEMLVHQAALSFKKWTGKEFPFDLIYPKLDEFF